jgi:hypothetical protein
MAAMRITPESRIISVEWLLSQYIMRNKLGYLSGMSLVGAYKGSIFKVVDQNSDKNIETIVISQMELDKDARKKNAVLQRKQYQ